MILVYTNSKERAMRLATCLDGVTLRNQEKVRCGNFELLKEKLEAEISDDGFVRAFFQGTPYVFIFSEGTTNTPKKMVDYNPEYAALSARPVPFIPSPFEYQIADTEFKERLHLYKQMGREATRIINAATDDIDGEIAFSVVASMFAKYGKPMSRVRPATMTETGVVEAFNAVESIDGFAGYTAACHLHKQLNWLVGCNATNALAKFNFERKLLATGRLESIILAMVAERETLVKEAQKQPLFTVRVDLKGKKKARLFAESDNALTQREATSLAERYLSVGEASVTKASTSDTTNNPVLLDMFTLQAHAAKKCNLTPVETTTAATWLYNRGYITWPTASKTLPWRVKPLFASAITTLAQTKAYQSKVKPSDIDLYLDWDKHEAPFKHVGLMTTDRVLPDDDTIPLPCKAVYDLIASTCISILRYKTRVHVEKANLSCGEDNLTYFNISEKEYDVCSPPPTTSPLLSEGDKLKVLAADVVSSPAPELFDEAELLDTLLPAISDGFCHSMDMFSVAIDNLTMWGQLQKAPNGRLSLTKTGQLVHKYIGDTTLSSVIDTLNWDRRLQAVAEETTSETHFVDDMHVYIEDICSEIHAAAEDIRAFGGAPKGSFSCPECQGRLVWPDDGGCKCSHCGFNIPGSISGHIMSKLDIANLLQKGTSDLISDFKSAQGKTFSARLIRDGKKITRTFLSPHKCPFCNGTMNEYAWGIKCNQETCGFALNTTVCGHTLLSKEVETVLSRRETEPLHLVNAKGKAFVASLVLTDEKKLQFVFPERKKE